ncbi:MAG: Glycosyl transferase, group 2 family protein [Anaerolineae bacterium]|nr:MAG: Glycosyl transferase, group 2 family protein [Anaerolineae bacterium]
MAKPLLSLCMIVKNEEANLPHCLDSVKDVVDEIIIVDTGSTDRTKEIALSYGAKLYDFEWIDDFSAARNFSLEKATGEWILVLDADEKLEKRTAKKLRELAKVSDVDAYVMIQQNFRSSQIQPVLDFQTIRFFRNCSYYRFRGRYHEGVHHSIQEHNGKIALDRQELVILHDGYLQNTAQGELRRKRAIRHLKAILDDDPHDVWAHLKLGMELYHDGDKDEAYNHLIKLFQSGSTVDLKHLPPIDTHEALVHLAQLAIYRGDFTLAKRCGIASRPLTQIFEFCLYSEFAYIVGSLGEIEILYRDGKQVGEEEYFELASIMSKISDLRKNYYDKLETAHKNLLDYLHNKCLLLASKSSGGK